MIKILRFLKLGVKCIKWKNWGYNLSKLKKNEIKSTIKPKCFLKN